mgnify:CR=1 FL=1
MGVTLGRLLGHFWVIFLNMFSNTFQRSSKDWKALKKETCLSKEREARKIEISSRGCQNIMQKRVRHGSKKKIPSQDFAQNDPNAKDTRPTPPHQTHSASLLWSLADPISSPPPFPRPPLLSFAAYQLLTCLASQRLSCSASQLYKFSASQLLSLSLLNFSVSKLLSFAAYELRRSRIYSQIAPKQIQKCVRTMATV